MPIYEFKCESCSHIDEVLMKISDPAPEKCSVCGGKVKKIMSQTTFSLKGTGWYMTDYKNTSQDKPASSSNSPSTDTQDSKPSSSTETGTATTAESSTTK